MTTEAIRVDGVSKVFTGLFGSQRVRALDDVSIDVATGEVFGLLGGNGAGKTTLVKILLDLTRATRGRTWIQGLPTSNPRARSRVGYLPEGHRFPGYLTARETLRIFGRMSGMDKADLDQRIPQLLSQLKIDRWLDVRVKKFSKGMTQRLGIAASLIHRPAVVFLDEPTDGVDPVGRREIRDFLQSYAREGATIFLNSHLLSEVELMCDRVAILRGGNVVAKGAVEELTATGSVYRLVAAGDENSVRTSVVESGASVERSDGHYLLSVDGVDQLNSTIDRLRAKGLLIEQLTPVKSTLEDVFVDLVRVDATVGGRSEVGE